MSRKYKFLDKEGLYFVSFATVDWIDVFTRPLYNDIIVDSLNWCISNIGMELYCWCIMPNHVHLIFSARDKNPEIILGRFKEFTSKKLVKAIAENPKESRKEWMLWMFKRAGEKSSNVTNYQFWRHDNKPIELWTPQVITQKADYIHNNPVKAGFVMDPQHWRYSSAIDYFGGKGLVGIQSIY